MPRPRTSIAQEDRVGCVLTWAGTHATTGCRVTVPEVQIYRFRNGRIVERWITLDLQDTRRQAGILPNPGR